jgi:hypothetical protein
MEKRGSSDERRTFFLRLIIVISAVGRRIVSGSTGRRLHLALSSIHSGVGNGGTPLRDMSGGKRLRGRKFAFEGVVDRCRTDLIDVSFEFSNMSIQGI